MLKGNPVHTHTLYTPWHAKRKFSATAIIQRYHLVSHTPSTRLLREAGDTSGNILGVHTSHAHAMRNAWFTKNIPSTLSLHMINATYPDLSQPISFTRRQPPPRIRKQPIIASPIQQTNNTAFNTDSTVYISIYHTVLSMLSSVTSRLLSIQTVQYSIYKYILHCILYAIHHNYKTALNTDSTVQYI